MKLASITIAAFVLAAPAANAQVPPPPPPPAVPVVAPPVPLPLPPVDVPLPPLLPVDVPMPIIDVPMPPIPVDIDSALLKAELALAQAPIEAIHAARFEYEHALPGFDWPDQVTVNASRSRDRENSYYEMGRSALDRRNWTDAINRFDQVAQLKGSRADAALYWKAYAQSKNAQRTEALATIAALLRDYPQSRYLNDARALEIELKRGEVSPESQQDEDLKLLAIQGLQHSDPEQAIPLLEKILNSSNSPRIKERALYVLALSNAPRAQEILLGIAKGAGNPDLQRKAIDYLATSARRNNGGARLEDVYRSASDPDVRLRVLRAYATAGDRARLLAAAQTEQNQDLRLAAIRYLGTRAAAADLAALYAKEANTEVRAQIVRSMVSAGRESTGTMLQDMYAKESVPEVKRAIISALHAQNNPEGLVAIARRETDPKLKAEIVRRLSTMTKSKVALEYLMEILNK